MPRPHELLEEAIKDRIAKTGKKPKAILPVARWEGRALGTFEKGDN